LADDGEVRFVAAEINRRATEVEQIYQGDQAEDDQAADASVDTQADRLMCLRVHRNGQGRRETGRD
jgi:hypothetical protein